MSVNAIVLAAGQGTRMRSSRPKPLHVMCGRPMVLHAVHALAELDVDHTVVVVGHESDSVIAAVERGAPDWAHVAFAEQTERRGTGHAAAIGLGRLAALLATPDIDDTTTVVVLPGDMPLVRAETIAGLVAAHEAGDRSATLLVAELDDPEGFGRIVRGRGGRVERIVEERDADAPTRALREVNAGIYAFRRDLLAPALRRVGTGNAQGEQYLTDVVGVLAATGHVVGAVTMDPAEAVGVNDRWQLALAERELRARTNRAWLLAGVTMFDPRQTFIDVTVSIGSDVTLYPGTILQGDTTIGDGCRIGPNSRLVDCLVGENSVVDTTVAESATIGSGAVVGPFAHLGVGRRVEDGQRTGSFYADPRP